MGKPRGGASARWRAGAKWIAWLVAGIAVMAGSGYLVAALMLFPSPLLPNERKVTRVIGLGADEARQELQQKGLSAEIAATEPHPTAASGVIIWQDPAEGTALPRGWVVSLTVSGGPPRVMVPDVRGLDLDLAQRLLKAVGLTFGAADTVDEKGAMSGVAVGTEPPARDSLAMGRSVIIHLSR